MQIAARNWQFLKPSMDSPYIIAVFLQYLFTHITQVLKRLLFCLSVLLMSAVSAEAGYISSAQALEKARHFMKGKTFSQAKVLKSMNGTSGGNRQPLFVFNASEGGYVIIAGDDRMPDVIGYSNTGSIDLDKLPPTMLGWLEEYAGQIRSLETTELTAKSRNRPSHTAIAPLISAKWKQSAPYNYMCPDGNGQDFYETVYNTGYRCVTGCVATAMAQLMYYWKWPESCPALDTYMSKQKKVRGLPPAKFKWDKMKDSYANNETGESSDAVAELMRYCGQAVGMEYGTASSAAAMSRETMVNVFNYSYSTRKIRRDNYDDMEWEDIIYRELAERRPVIYSCHMKNSGHDFLIDGYDGKGYFHFNWGWGNMSDNYFLLSLTGDSASGSESDSRKDGNFLTQEVWIGINPHREGDPDIYASVSRDGLTATLYYDRNPVSRHGIDFLTNPPAAGVTTVVIDGSFANFRLHTAKRLFAEFRDLKTIRGMSNLKTDHVTDMSYMFYNCGNLANMDVSHFKTGKVKDMSYMFYNCGKLANADVSGFRTDSVSNMKCTFYGCSALTGLDVSRFSTGNVKDMSYMFYNCGNLQSLDVSRFKTGNCADIRSMFYGCSALTELDVSGFDTEKVTNMSYTFYNCAKLQRLDVSRFRTGRVNDLESMFYGCSELTAIDLRGFVTGNATSMSYMFYNCANLVNLDISRFDTGNVTNMKSIFSGCSALRNLDVSGFNTAKVRDMSYMFYKCANLERLDVNRFRTENTTGFGAMFYGCSALEELDVSGFVTGKADNMSFMFYKCSALKSLDVSRFATANVTNMKSMFTGCSGLESLDVALFATGRVTDMSYMFCNCSGLKRLDLGHWETGQVTDCKSMFSGCLALTVLDVSGFRTGKVKDMSHMFYNCPNLVTVYGGDGWNTDNAAKSDDMFYGCLSVTGGRGTRYDNQHTDKGYARPDGGPGAPGYFTDNAAAAPGAAENP